jgi:RNA polymerase sigma-70 factor (ECF subfamily)
MEFFGRNEQNDFESSSETARADEELLKLSLEDPRYFSMIVDKYQDAFFRAAVRVVKQKEEAEDIVQEAFTKIYMNAPKFQKQEGASFKSWGYKIVLNTAFTHYQKAKRHMENGVEFDDPLHMEQVLSIEAERTPIAKEIVMEAIKELPDDLRGILTMHYLEDLSYKQIAEKNNLTIPAIKMKLFRARGAFKKVVESQN